MTYRQSKQFEQHSNKNRIENNDKLYYPIQVGSNEPDAHSCFCNIITPTQSHAISIPYLFDNLYFNFMFSPNPLKQC